jgi:dihydroorotate dehydrogenase electron transfer subunit
MKQTRAKIIFNKRSGPERFHMRLEAPLIAKRARPGQFMMIKCSEGPGFMLRRPLAFHRIGDTTFDCLYQVVGKGTEILSARRPGGTLDVIGPLGNGFSTLHAIHSPRSTFLVAGGIAVAPLLSLAEKIARDVGPQAFSVVIGARTRGHILCDKEFKRLGAKVHVATEDGSMGQKGLATAALKDLLRTTNHRSRITIYACGPKGMLKEVALIARANKARCEVSLEEKMACGSGVCLGCAVKTTKGYKMVCKDGPVFNAEEIIW